MFVFLNFSGLGSVVRATDHLFVRVSDDEELANCFSDVTVHWNGMKGMLV